jgi:hypothetical protein
MDYRWRVISEAEQFDKIPGMEPAANWFMFGPGRSAYFRYVAEPFEESPPFDTLISTIPVVFDYPEASKNNPALLEIASALGLPLGSLSGYFFTNRELLSEDLIRVDSSGEVFIEPELRKQLAVSRASFKFSAPISAGVPTVPTFEGGPEPLPPVGGWPVGTVITAIVDDGLGFANEWFRDADNKSRFQYMWWQDAHQTSATGVPFGKELGKFEIDQLISKHENSGIGDASIYREFGTIDFSSARRSTVALGLTHGTHVADVAAGFDRVANRQDRPIIGVQLWQEAVERGTGAELDIYILAGVDYILNRARRMSPESGNKLPVVINLSYGFNIGPHDGTSVLEKNLARLVKEYEAEGGHVSLVISAGNNQLSRTHSEISYHSDRPVESRDLEWQIFPDDRTGTYMEMWLPYSSDVDDANATLQPNFIDDRYTFTVTTPSGLTSPVIQCGHGQGVRLLAIEGGNEFVVFEAKYNFVAGHTCKGLLRFYLTPTSIIAADTGPWKNAHTSPSGVWRIHIQRKPFDLQSLPPEGIHETISTWILSDEEVYGYPLMGRQSYFVNDCYEVHDEQGRLIVEDPIGSECVVSRKSLINAMATGDEVFVAGSYYERERELTEYSAGGPRISGKDDALAGQRVPNAVAAAEGSRVHFGVLASGSMSGSVLPMGGTSVAAPMLAREIANQIANQLLSSGVPESAETSVLASLSLIPGLSINRGGFGLLSPEQRVKVERFIVDSPPV